MFSIVAAHNSSIYPHSRENTTHLPTKRDVPLPQHQPDLVDLLPEHASESSVLYDAQVQILLRVLHDRRTIELVSLSTDASPVRIAFPAPIIPCPAVIYDNPEIHVIACTTSGSVYRLVLPPPSLWQHETLDDWYTEYGIRHSAENLLGPVHVKEAGSEFIALRDGGILNLDATRSSDDTKYLEWTETVLRPPVSISFSSLIPSYYRTQAGASQAISFATVPNPSPSLILFTLQRDRQLRVWENGGCVATVQIPPTYSFSSSSKTTTILGPEPQRLLYVIPPDDPDASDDGLQLLVFMPSAAGGYFSLYRLSAKGSGGTRALQHVGSRVCSDGGDRHIRDYLVINDVLWVLWDDQGRSTVEHTDMDLDTEDEGYWASVSAAPETEISSTHFEDHLATHGSFSITYLSALLRPGMFSRYTLRAALQQYTTQLSSLPGPKSHILTASYPTLSEHIAAVVGSTVDLSTDPQTGELLWNPYWNALKRDWEGFVARCREIERNARWPLALGLTAYGEPIVIERERIAAVVPDDRAIQVHHLVFHQSADEEDQDISDSVRLLRTAATLRAGFSTLENLALDKVMVDATRQDVAFSYLDVASDLCRLHMLDTLPIETENMVLDLLDRFNDVESVMDMILDDIVGLDRVKLEEQSDDDVPETVDSSTRTWQTALTAAYLSSTIESRHEMALSLFALALFIAEHRPDTISREPSILGKIFAAVQSIGILQYIARHPAGDPETPSALHEEDDVAALLQGMHVSGSSMKRNIPTYSMMHLILLSHPSPPGSDLSSPLSPGQAAHRFLRNIELLRLRDVPAAALPEVQFVHMLWGLGHREVAREVAEWLPRTPSIGYMFGRIWLDSGRTDDAAGILERVGDCTVMIDDDNRETLRAVLPTDVSLDSPASYYRHVASLFERLALPSNVMQFSKLAIENTPVEETKDLWFKVFKANVDLGLYEEAYVALVSSPFPELQRELIRHLVSAMCDNDEVERLTTLNFVGFQSDVENTLAFKARNTDPRYKNYSQVLYAWYIFRGDYRSAGGVMYQHGRRLAETQLQHQGDFQDIASAQARSYLAAINALSLVDYKNAWIEFAVSSTENSKQKRPKLSLHIPEEEFSSEGLDIEVVSLADIKLEYILVLSRLEIIGQFADLDYSLSPTEIVTHYMQAGMLDSAMSAARSLKVDMIPLFANLTAQCMRLAERADDDTDPATIPWLLSDRVSSWEGSNSQRAWRYLRISLETHDSAEQDYTYRKISFQKILDLERSSRVPAWLVKFFQNRQPEYLIRTYLKYGLVQDALRESLSMVQKATSSLNLAPPHQSSSTWLPYNLIDQVLRAADDQKDSFSPEDKGLAQKLRADIEIRVKRMKTWSDAPTR